MEQRQIKIYIVLRLNTNSATPVLKLRVLRLIDLVLSVQQYLASHALIIAGGSRTECNVNVQDFCACHTFTAMKPEESRELLPEEKAATVSYAKLCHGNALVNAY